MSDKILKWGFIGAGRISNDFCLALDKCERKHKIVAVAASSLERAEEFIRDRRLEAKAYGTYEAIFTDADVGRW